ncbi:hypothetical protein [Microterricola viridarii]|uniref:Uncharacterized protein n=1 Tax=Microterricola viridarii TaxID=412690 RepID=A0A1H1YL17_9MICO|nr:hypothetical protein [Microterricola viridarii]SDT22113.1 hypothetical protein SAMN04489834_3124 [Microterricola viridarii]
MTDPASSPWCQEAAFRESFADAAFWPHVLQRQERGDEPDFDPDVPTSYQIDPCPESGEHGACAYDTEGRPMTHITEREDE